MAGQAGSSPDEQVLGLKDVASTTHGGRCCGCRLREAGLRTLIECKRTLLHYAAAQGPGTNTVGNRHPKFAKR